MRHWTKLMRPALVHLALREGTAVVPLCGSWGESKNWTLSREVVSCPECKAAAERRDRAPDGATGSARSGVPPRD